MSTRKAHEYFERRPSEWNILGFLNECDQEPFQNKISVYLMSLEIITQTEGGRRQKQAQELYSRYKEASYTSFFFLFFSFFFFFFEMVAGRGSLRFPPFKSLSRAMILVGGASDL